MNNLGDQGLSLWDPRDGFYYDVLHPEHGKPLPLKIRSMVGLIPLCAVETLSSEIVDTLPGFKRRMQWFVENRPEMSEHLETQTMPDGRVLRFLSLANREHLRRVLHYMLDENEFLSPYGIRSLSRFHRDHPYLFCVHGTVHQVHYEPAESSTNLFGGNSNWRGPVWFPVNFLLIETLQKFHDYLGDSYKIAYPTGSGRMSTLREVAADLSHRLVNLFLRAADGRRAVYGGMEKFQHDPHWRELILFYEYFHGDSGAGLGASHQTGWTSLVANLLINHPATHRNG